MEQRFRDGAVAGSWTAPLIPPVELALGIAWFAWIALAWFAKDRKGGWFKTVLLVCMLAAALSLPALAWNHSQWLPGVLTIPMFLLLGKTWELASGSFSGFGRLDTPTGFVLWAVVLPETRRSDDAAVRAAIRKRSWKLAVRVFAKIAVFWSLVAVNQAWAFQDVRPLQLLWGALVIYFTFSGVRDGIALACAAVGAESCPMFDSPLIARNPRDFWGRRWNLWFTQTAHRMIFEPLGGRQRPLLAAAGVFGFSALLHEVIATVGLRSLDGRMTLFFVVQGLGAVAFTKLSQRWPTPLSRPVAVALHFAWMWLTVAWFVDPMDGFLNLSAWTTDGAVRFLF
jgi:hypothetical protein